MSGCLLRRIVKRISLNRLTMSVKENARDLAAEAKKDCRCKKASFTRRYNEFQNLIKAEVQGKRLMRSWFERMRPWTNLMRII